MIEAEDIMESSRSRRCKTVQTICIHTQSLDPDAVVKAPFGTPIPRESANTNTAQNGSSDLVALRVELISR